MAVVTPFRLGLATLAAILTCALAPASASAVDRQPYRQLHGATEQVELLVGSYNIRADRTTAVFLQAVKALLPRVDVAGLQEVNSHDKEHALASLSTQGWSYYRPSPGEQNPVVWNDARFTFLDAHPVLLHEAADVGDEVPGRPSEIRAQYATVVHLQDLATDRTVTIINVHLVPGAVHAGGPWADRPLLYKFYKQEVRALASATANEASLGQVFVLGDFNAGFVSDQKFHRPGLPYATFGRLGMPSMWATRHPARRGTRGRALLDQVYSSQAASDARVAFDIKFSDHRPAVATYQLDVQPADQPTPHRAGNPPAGYSRVVPRVMVVPS